MPLATVVSIEQVSGQSCGQAPRTWVVVECGKLEDVSFMGRGNPPAQPE